MNWLLRQSPWLHSQNLVIVTPHLDTFLWLCKVLLWSWPWLQEFKLASVSWIAVWSGAVISRWHLTKNVSSIKNTRHFYIFFATTWLTAWFFQFGKGFVEPKRVGLVREKKRVGSDQGPTLNYASPEGQRCLEPTLAFVVQPPLPPGRSGRDVVVGWPRWLRSGSCGVRRQVWPWMPRQESSVEHRRSRLLRCRFLSDEWPRKWGPFDFGSKNRFIGGDSWIEMIEIPMKHPCDFMGHVARLGCILSRSKFLTLVSREVGPHQLGDVAESSKIFSKSRSSFFLFSVFSQKYNPLDVLGRIRIF